MDGFRYFTLLLSCIALTRPVLAAKYGVGFSLSFDYGVAAIHYANGSSAGIAKVEGGWDYRQMMRAQNWTQLPPQDTSSYHSTDQERNSQHAYWPIGMALQSSRNHLPPWLGGLPLDAEVETMSRMLRALKTAMDSYIGTRITHAEVIFPARPSKQLLNTLNSASSIVSLELPVLLRSAAGQLATSANDIRGNDRRSFHLPEHLVLAVDYSRAALTAVLLCQDSGVIDTIRGIQNITLGADNWSLDTRDQIVTELRNIMQLPVESPYGTQLGKIQGLVLLGENGADERLKEALMDAFGDTGSYASMKKALSGGHDRINPVYAAAIGTAADCLVRLNEPEGGFLCSVPI